MFGMHPSHFAAPHHAVPWTDKATASVSEEGREHDPFSRYSSSSPARDAEHEFSIREGRDTGNRKIIRPT